MLPRLRGPPGAPTIFARPRRLLNLPPAQPARSGRSGATLEAFGLVRVTLAG